MAQHVWACLKQENKDPKRNHTPSE
jgi:hypothetical protein